MKPVDAAAVRPLALALCLAHAVALSAAPLGEMVPEKHNAAWWAPDGATAAVFMPSRAGAEGAVLAIDKRGLSAHPAQPPTLDLRSDAKAFELVSGAVRFRFAHAPTGRDRMSFEPAGRHFGVRLNGRASPPSSEDLERLWKDPSPTLRIRFVNATEAAFSIVGEAAPPARRRDPQPVAEPVLAPQRPLPPKTQTDAVLQTARRAVFEIRVQTPTPGVRLRSMAFGLGEGGFAVTPLQPLRAASGAWALLPDYPDPVPLELWEARPALDLALIRLSPEALRPDDRRPVLPIASSDPAPGTEVWAMGIDADGRSAVAVGKVTKTSPWARLPDAARSALDYDNLSHWIQHDVPLTLDHSGGPLIDGRGRLVGVSTWLWRDTSSPDAAGSVRRGAPAPSRGPRVALHASHLRSLFDTRPSQPIGFAGAKSRLARQRAPHHAAARVEIKHERYGAPAHLRLAVQRLAQGTACPLCKGEGRIIDAQKVLEKRREERRRQMRERQRRSSTETAEPAAPDETEGETPEKDETEDSKQEDLTKACPRCDESGFQQAEAVFGLGTTTVMALAAVDRAAEGYQDARVFMEERLLDLVELNPQGLARRLNAQARRHLHRTHLKLGTPVMLMGVAESPEDGGVVKIQLGAFGPDVLVIDPEIATRRAGGIVLAGGVLSGYLNDAKGKPVPVLQRGFVLNIETEGTGKDAAASKTEAWKRFAESRRVQR